MVTDCLGTKNLYFVVLFCTVELSELFFCVLFFDDLDISLLSFSLSPVLFVSLSGVLLTSPSLNFFVFF